MNKTVLNNYTTLAQRSQLRLDEKNGIIYGQRSGFPVLVYAADARYPYLLTVSLSAARVGGALDKDAWKAFSKEHKPVQNVKNEGNIVAMHLAANNNVDKLCDNFNQSLDALIGFLMANDYTKVCQFCGQEIDTEPYYVGSSLMHLCPSCAARVSQDMQLSSQKQKEKKENVAAGIVGALVGSLIGVLCIVLVGQLGYVAAVSGLVMAICTLKGYELLGGKISVKGIVISAVLMVVMTFVGDQIDWAIVIMRELGYDLMYSFRLIPLLLADGSIVASSYWGNLALVYIFAVIGAVPCAMSMIRGQKEKSRMFKIGTM